MRWSSLVSSSVALSACLPPAPALDAGDADATKPPPHDTATGDGSPAATTGTAGDDSSLPTIRIATYNVEGLDLGGEAVSQADHVARFVADAQLDVLVVQEIQAEGADADVTSLSTALSLAGLDLDHRFVTAQSDGYNAIGVWSRHAINEADAVLDDNTRTVARVHIDTSSGPLWLYGVHLKSGGQADDQAVRRDEATRLAAWLRQHHTLADEFVIVLGDLNTMTAADWSDGGTLDLVTLAEDDDPSDDLWAVNAQALADQATFPAGNSVLDHICLSPAAAARYVAGSIAVAEPLGDGPTGPSDHYPVVAALKL